MKTERSFPAIKATAVLMTLVLSAGPVTACTEKTTVNTDNTTQITDESEKDSGGKTETTYNGSRRFATDYPLEIKEQKSDFLDDWSIWKRQEDGVTFLQIDNTGFHGRETEIEFLSFRVYDSAEDAKDAFDGYYNSSKEFDNGRFWEEGDSWFISEKPGVMDASIVWMNYIEDNVIISTHLGMVSALSKEDYADTSSGSGKSDAANRKNYILDNSSSIRDYVIGVIMEA